MDRVSHLGRDDLLKQARDARACGNRLAALGALQSAALLEPGDVGIRLEVASELRALNRTSEAEAIYRTVLNGNDKQLSAIIGLGQIKSIQLDRNASLELFQQAERLAPERLGVKLEIGRLLRELRRFDEAEIALRDLLEKRPQNVNAYIQLALLKRQQRDLQSSLDLFQTAAALDPERVGIQLEIANGLRELGRLEDARVVLEGLIERDPKSFGAHVGLGHLYRKRGDHAKAIEAFTAAAAVQPNHVDVRLEWARELQALDRLNEAEAILSKLLDEDPRHFGALNERGHLYRRRGNHAGASESFMAAVAVEPNHVGVRLEWARELRALNHFDQADALLSELLAKEPDHFGAVNERGHLYRRSGNHAAAADAFMAAVALQPNHASVRLEWARELRVLDRFEQAGAVINELLVEYPHHFGALNERGHLYRKCGNHEGAVEAFMAASAAQPSHVGVRLELAREFTLLRHPAKAEALLQNIHEKFPNNAKAPLALSRLARQEGNEIGSLHYLKIASEIDDKDLTTRLELAAEYAVHDRFDEAFDLVRSIIGIDQHNRSAWSRLGNCFLATGKPQQAEAAFEAARKIDPSRIETLIDLAQANTAAGHSEKADAFLKQAIAHDPTNFAALAASAKQALLVEDTESAADFARRAKTFHPNDLRAHLLSARIASDAQNYEEAFAYLAEAIRIFGPLPAIRSVQIFFLRQQRLHTTARLIAAEVYDPKMPFPLWAECVALANTLGDFAQFEKLLANSVAVTPSEKAVTMVFRAQLAEAKRDYRSAIVGYGAALELNPKVGRWHSELARCHLLVAETDTAYNHLKTSAALDTRHNTANGRSTKPSQQHIGQILDEFQLDRQTLAQLRAIAQLPALQQIEPLKCLVQQTPDQTAPALLLMLAMRTSGLFNSECPAATSPIPKRIVQYWDTKTPPNDLRELMKSWQVHHPQYKYDLFNDASVQSFLEDRFDAKVIDAFRRAQHPAQRADIFRLAYLVAEGGFYVDADDRCLGNIELLYPGSISLAIYQENYGTIGNNIIGASAGHPVILQAFRLATDAMLRGDRDIIWLSTGPGLLTRTFAHVLASSNSNLLASTVVRELGETQRIVGLHCPAQYKKTDKHWSRAAFRIQ